MMPHRIQMLILSYRNPILRPKPEKTVVGKPTRGVGFSTSSDFSSQEGRMITRAHIQFDGMSVPLGNDARAGT